MSHKHYNIYNYHYLKHYGHTFQAHRPADIKELHAYLNKQIGFATDDKVLDAGCGVCGPAIYFTLHNDIKIEAITNSEKQIETASELILNNGLENKIKLHLNDYHNIEKIFKSESFNKIIFLESFGHSKKKDKLLQASYNLLRFEGILYIKDYFAAEITGSLLRKKLMNRANRNLRKTYCYYLADIYKTLKKCRKLGFEIDFISKPKFSLCNDNVVGAFEKELNIDLFKNEYMPIIVEPLELKLKKVIKDVAI